jgi:DNA-binding HxlR family transcriptional regulator
MRAMRGACRYTDLRNGLSGIATNLLAERLRELERAGVIAREDAPPPIASTLFRLTPRGEQLRPALEDLIRWGIPLMTEQRPDDAVRSHWIAYALELMLTDGRPDPSPVTIELDIGDEPIILETRDGAIHARIGRTDNADAVISGEARQIMGLFLGLTELADAEAAGLSYQGDPAILDRIGPLHPVTV